MPLLMLKDVPRYECLLKAASKYPTLDPTASDAFLNLLRTGDTVFAAEGRFLAQHNISQGRFTVLMLLNRLGGTFDPRGTGGGSGRDAGDDDRAARYAGERRHRQPGR